MLKVVYNFLNKVRSYIYIYIYSSPSHGLKSHITKNKSIRIVGFASSFALLLLATISIFPITHKPDQAEATPGTVEIPTLTISTESINVDLTPTSSLGTFAKSPDANISVSTSNYTGYELKIKALDSVNPTKLINTNDSTYYLDTIENATTESDFMANTTSAANDYNGKWGYLPSIIYDNTTSSYINNTNYLPSPTDTTYDILNHTTAANGSDNTCTDPLSTACSTHAYTIALGARADYTKPNGVYTNPYELIAVANPIAYAITYYSYNDNTGNNEVVGTQASETGTATVTLSPTLNSSTLVSGNTIVRNGLDANSYTFKSWCLGTVNSTAEYAPATTCTGTEYANGSSIAGATLPIDPTIDNTDIKLYAVWDPTTFNEAYTNAGVTTKVSGHYRMLDMSSNICGAITIGQKEQLTDSRSGNYVYWVAKLKDNKCWMVQNLRLGTNGNVTLTSADSNISASSWVLNNKLADGKFPATLITDDVLESPIAVYNNNAYYCSPVSDNNFVGCYYNWYSSTAGTGTTSVTGKDLPDGKDASSSICPKGWYLPRGAVNSDFWALYNEYHSSSQMLVDNPATTYDNASGIYLPGFLLSGSYGWDGIVGAGLGVNSRMWLRTAYSSGHAYATLITADQIRQDHINKYHGSSIRCLAYSD